MPSRSLQSRDAVTIDGEGRFVSCLARFQSLNEGAYDDQYLSIWDWKLGRLACVSSLIGVNPLAQLMLNGIPRNYPSTQGVKRITPRVLYSLTRLDSSLPMRLGGTLPKIRNSSSSSYI
ncbi:hypothetical protein DL93DRAFT_2083492 [Clavulina sp. PMI_390]|nr:hypothetical protein DL93DRAFT_2083492 [Clavulina sp. PMI_390]